ncbi:MAG TPA: hypothetical protein VGM98_02635 [Schlesneria sp.]|jgi:hypothetical protein
MSTLMNARAGGTINTCRFVVPDTSHANGAVQASDGTHLPLGIAQQAGRLRPDPVFTSTQVLEAAEVGEVIGIYPPGCVGVGLLCNATWSAGDLLMSDSTGQGVVATTGKFYGARAEGPGTVGAICPVTVITGLLP